MSRAPQTLLAVATLTAVPACGDGGPRTETRTVEIEEIEFCSVGGYQLDIAQMLAFRPRVTVHPTVVELPVPTPFPPETESIRWQVQELNFEVVGPDEETLATFGPETDSALLRNVFLGRDAKDDAGGDVLAFEQDGAGNVFASGDELVGVVEFRINSETDVIDGSTPGYARAFDPNPNGIDPTGMDFNVCAPKGPGQRTRVEFDGGWAEVDRRGGLNFVPGSISQTVVAIRGEFDGDSFDVTDPSSLSYSLVQFVGDEEFSALAIPSSGVAAACGIAMMNLNIDQLSEDIWPPRVSLINCGGAELDQRNIFNVATSDLPPV